MEKLISERIKSAISEQVFPGCTVGWIKNGKQKILPFGRFTYDHRSKVVREDSIYDVASITKSIPTSSSLLTFIDSGLIKLDSPVHKYIPEFENKDDVKIKHLLSYTLDLDIPEMSKIAKENGVDVLSMIFKAKLKQPPGSVHVYTNASAILMGLLVERISGEKLPKFSRDYFFSRLKMNRTTFNPLKIFSKQEIVPTEISDWRKGLIHGEVHDESSYILEKKGYYLGASGLFSTTPDILKFTQVLLNKGNFGKQTFFSQDMVEKMSKDQIDIPNIHTGLGWEVNEPARMGKYAKEILGKSGFTGCMVMINQKKNSSLVILSNRIHPVRPKNTVAINSVRRDIADIVFG